MRQLGFTPAYDPKEIIEEISFGLRMDRVDADI